MVGWHHQLDGHRFEQILGDSEEQGRLACCSPQGHKESDVIEQLNSSSSSLPLSKAELPHSTPIQSMS